MLSFAQNWEQYKNGFGQLAGEFWFGNENVYGLTKPTVAPKKSQLLMNMKMKGT